MWNEPVGGPSYDFGVELGEMRRLATGLMARHGGSAIAVFVVAWFLQSAGIVTVLGWVVTMPVGCLMAAYTYVRLTGGDTAR